MVNARLRAMVARDPGEPHRASTPLELFFDLCFVVAVAQAAAQLHHSVVETQITAGVLGYAMVFFAIWWAWVNFTWFASAYDTDDIPYRLLTLLQIAGVLVLAAGVPAAAARYDFTTITIGYVFMRAAMVAQWLRVAREYPAGRATAQRYAAGIGVCQIGWVVRLALPRPWDEIGFAILVLAELAVPMWAEYGAGITSWHPGHITERYGLFTLIVLGECVAAATAAVGAAVSGGGLSAPLLILAAGALLLIFGLWWFYYRHDASEELRASQRFTFVWGYGHYAVFAAVAALGAGLAVAVESLGHTTGVSAVTAAFAVAIPTAIYLVVTGGLHAHARSGSGADWFRVTVTAVLVLAAAAASAAIGPAGAISIMGVLVAALVVGILMGSG